MKIESYLTTDSGQNVSAAMQCFTINLLKDVLVHTGNLENGKKHLKAYCDNEQLEYNAVEHNLNLFLGLFNDYRKTKSPVLYRFLKLQARLCFVDEQLFGLLAIVPPDEDYPDGIENLNTHCKTTDSGSAYHGGMVGGHLIGL